MTTLVVALVGLCADLLLIVVLYAGDVAQARREARRERKRYEQWRRLAAIFQQVAHEERQRGDGWKERALHPELRPFWEVIERAAEELERER